MSEGSSLINLDIGKFAKPANTFIEKVSDAVGGVAKPWQIKRVANAEAEARLIQAKANFQASEIEQRGIIRMVREEGQKQQNIESITHKAAALLNEDAAPERLENDWIVHFFDRCRLISDDEMQSLWARVLAGETNGQSNFTKRTIDLISTLEKSDAELFTKLCSYVWDFENGVLVIFGKEDWDFGSEAPNFPILSHLDSIGLIRFDSIGCFRRYDMEKETFLKYFHKEFKVLFGDNDKREMDIGIALLTNVGRELSSICNPVYDENYCKKTINEWKRRGVPIQPICV